MEARRASAVDLVRQYIDDERVALGQRDLVAEALSEVKGLFTRTWKNDQWDWFVVHTRLGSPANRVSRGCSQALGSMARGLRKDQPDMVAAGRADFALWAGSRWLTAWVEGRSPLEDGWGFVYLLSTPQERDVVKIGFTTRPVEQRVAEINTATGVVAPFGVRRVWRVKDPHTVERLVHETLGGYRVRPDREFFAIDGRDAIDQINVIVRAHQASA